MSESDSAPKPAAPKPGDVETLLRQRDELDRVIREQFQRRVAVIFTDIQGSTQYFERYGDLAGRAMVQRHNDLLFPLIAESGGRVVKTIGDAIMAFFENSASAVQAAMRMQRALAEKNEVWPERERIHIRIGVHVGEALVDAADVYGDTVNTAARIEAQANGDEILISDAVRAELGAGAPGLRARGAVKLKGKAAEVPLYEIRWRERESVVAAASSGNRRWVAIGGAAVGAIAILGVAVHALHGRGAGPSAPASPSAPAQVATQQGATTAHGPTLESPSTVPGGAASPATSGPAGSASVSAPQNRTEPVPTLGAGRTHPALAAAGSSDAPAANGSSNARAPNGSPKGPAANASSSAAANRSSGAASAAPRPASVVTTPPASARTPSPPTQPSSPARTVADRHATSSATAHHPHSTHGKATVTPAHAVAPETTASSPTGTVRIHVFPFADVFVDGKRVGKGTMDVQVTVPAGDHQLRLVNPGFPEKKLTLHVKPGANEEQDLSLTR